MRFPYLLQRLRRSPMPYLLTFTVSLAMALLLGLLALGDVRLSRKIDEVYQNTTVTCDVTNLTGTQADHLQLPAWVLRLLLGEKGPDMGPDYKANPLEARFQDYLIGGQAKLTLSAVYHGNAVSLIGITGLSADTMLRVENGCVITWREGYDGAVFSKEADACLVPEGWVTEEEETLSLSLADGEALSLTLKIAGTYHGELEAVYCPFASAMRWSMESQGMILADSASATFLDCRKIDEFWAVCGSLYFAAPNAKGTPTPWEGNAVYAAYPFALTINDSTLRQTVGSLQKNRELSQLCRLVITALAAVLSFVKSFLLIRQREKALALQCVMGCGKRSIFLESWAEDSIPALLGLGLGAAISGLLCRPPVSSVILTLASGVIGAALAILTFLQRDLIKALKGVD